MSEKIEKLEVLKGNSTYYYTGVVTETKDGWIHIETIKGESLNFRREQIMGRLELRGDEKHGKDNNHSLY